MLKLTKTGLGLLTRQYRSVLKKCWMINLGVFALGAAIMPSEAIAGLLCYDSNDGTVKYSTGTVCPYGTLMSLGSIKSTATIGDFSTALGGYAQATGTYSMALGSVAKASGTSSVALGDRANAYGEGSSAFGYGTTAGLASDDTTTDSFPRYATAIGSYATATGQYALALGNQFSDETTKTTASGDNSIAIGTGAVASSKNAVVIGTNSTDGGEDTISVGNSTTKRKIVNVAAGVNANDAATKGQLDTALNNYYTKYGLGGKKQLSSLAVCGASPRQGILSLQSAILCESEAMPAALKGQIAGRLEAQPKSSDDNIGFKSQFTSSDDNIGFAAANDNATITTIAA